MNNSVQSGSNSLTNTTYEAGLLEWNDLILISGGHQRTFVAASKRQELGPPFLFWPQRMEKAAIPVMYQAVMSVALHGSVRGHT